MRDYTNLGDENGSSENMGRIRGCQVFNWVVCVRRVLFMCFQVSATFAIHGWKVALAPNATSSLDDPIRAHIVEIPATKSYS
jgi:hypothetical protein